MSLLYDSTTAADIPPGVARAGYCDGIYRWSDAELAGALRIAVSAATDDGHALDVETGDATPAQAPGWVVRARSRGVSRPWVYCNRSNRSAVEFNLNKFGLLTDQVALWVATLDGTRTVPAGPYPVAAVQYAGSGSSGGHYDISLVNDLFGPGAGILEDSMDQATFDQLVDGNPKLAAIYRVLSPVSLQQVLDAVHQLQIPTGTGLDAAHAAMLQDVHDIVGRIEAALKAA